MGKSTINGDFQYLCNKLPEGKGIPSRIIRLDPRNETLMPLIRSLGDDIFAGDLR